MTLRQIVKQLRQEGHKVSYRRRSDGGILITKIDAQRFSAATGNKVARAYVGESLSENRTIQLIYAKTAKKWKRAKLNENPNVGELKYKRVKRIAKEEGIEKVSEYLSEKEKYASGIAYTENIRVLKVAIERLATIYESPELQKLADDIWNNAANIRDEWILPAYEELYEINGKRAAMNTVTKAKINQIIKNVREVLRLD